MDYWNGRKLYRPNGTPWLMHSNVQSTLSAPKLAGYTSEDGKAVARGGWPQIVDIGTHYELVKVLSPKKSKAGRSRKYLLPGFIFCECGTAMIANVSLEYGLNRAPRTDPLTPRVVDGRQHARAHRPPAWAGVGRRSATPSR